MNTNYTKQYLVSVVEENFKTLNLFKKLISFVPSANEGVYFQGDFRTILRTDFKKIHLFRTSDEVIAQDIAKTINTYSNLDLTLSVQNVRKQHVNLTPFF